jgi:DnaJ-class molecular chaperone
MVEDLYAQLDVEKTASDVEIKKAYKKLVLILHPDKCKGDPQMTERFRCVQEAYTILSDPEKRSWYDKTGQVSREDNLNNRMPTDFSDILGGLFGGFHGNNKRHEQRRVDSATIPVTLADVFNGNIKTLSFEIPDACPECHGHGVADPANDFIDCITCNGSGTRAVQVGPFMVAQSQCQSCSGIGRMVRPGRQCSKCKGARTVPTRRSFDVRLPRGIPDGHVHVVSEKGSFNQEEMRCADMRLIFSYEMPEYMRFEGDDAVALLDLTLAEVLYGFTKILTPWSVPITIATTGYMNPSREMRLSGQGLPRYKKPQQFMDLVVRFNVVYPDSFVEKNS